jgi:hypothetical protein
MSMQKRSPRTAVATIGYAADDRGHGIAYAKIWSTAAEADRTRLESVTRVEFHVRVRPALRGREVAYAAVEAVAAKLVEAKVAIAELRVADAQLATDLEQRRAVPADLQLPYIALRCTLNRLASFSVVACDDGTARDLTARARAELMLDRAA